MDGYYSYVRMKEGDRFVVPPSLLGTVADDCKSECESMRETKNDFANRAANLQIQSVNVPNKNF